MKKIICSPHGIVALCVKWTVSHTFWECRQLIREGKSVEDAYWALVVQDIQEACDLFHPLYNESNGGDGYISLEVSPLLANETQQTIESAKYLHNVVNRPNVLIKIPATLECIESIKQVIASSISVNVTVSTDIFVTCHNISWFSNIWISFAAVIFFFNETLQTWTRTFRNIHMWAEEKDCERSSMNSFLMNLIKVFHMIYYLVVTLCSLFSL